MNTKRASVLKTIPLLCWLLAFPAFGEDLYLEGNLAAGAYDSSGQIIMRNNCTVDPGVTVTTLSTYETTLQPETEIRQGSDFTAGIRDNDGLSNYCELQYFNTLAYGPDDDPDGDGLGNYDECLQGTHPFYNENNPDRDSDGLPDLWELAYWVGDLSHSGDEDTDGDGVKNSLECQLDSDPTLNDLPGPGVHYEYDEQGNTTKIYRIPLQ